MEETNILKNTKKRFLGLFDNPIVKRNKSNKHAGKTDSNFFLMLHEIPTLIELIQDSKTVP